MAGGLESYFYNSMPNCGTLTLHTGACLIFRYPPSLPRCYGPASLLFHYNARRRAINRSTSNFTTRRGLRFFTTPDGICDILRYIYVSHKAIAPPRNLVTWITKHVEMENKSPRDAGGHSAGYDCRRNRAGNKISQHCFAIGV